VAIPERACVHSAFAVAAWGALAVLLAGCASEPVKTPSVSTHHPSRGMVTLTYEFGPDESRTPDWKRAARQALRYCRELGYSAAEVAGKPDEECKADNRYRRCTRYFVSRTWRCRTAE